MYDGPQLSRQNQTPHGKSKNFTAKPKTSRQNQIPHSKNTIGLVLPWVFAFPVRYLVLCCEVFGFVVRSLVLPWGFWFCREVFCFCREVFGFAVRFLVLPWQLWATVFMKLKLKFFDLRSTEFFVQRNIIQRPPTCETVKTGKIWKPFQIPSTQENTDVELGYVICIR